MSGPTSTMEIGGDGVAVIRLQNPPVNALHPDGELSGCICTEAATHHCVHVGLYVCSKNRRCRRAWLRHARLCSPAPC